MRNKSEEKGFFTEEKKSGSGLFLAVLGLKSL